MVIIKRILLKMDSEMVKRILELEKLNGILKIKMDERLT
jgi:hypothetical protein